MRVVVRIGLVAWVVFATMARAQGIPWDRIGDARALTDAQREVAAEALRTARCYGDCDGTVLECLNANDPTGVRMANFIARRAAANRGLSSILDSVRNRKLSAFPERTCDVDVSNLVPSGNRNAAVRVVIFADFECPYCKVAAPSLRKLSVEMSDSISLWFMNYPLSQNPRSTAAAIAYLAAERQGLGWEMFDELFARGGDLGDAQLDSCAAAAGVGLDQFHADLGAPELFERVQREKGIGAGCGVRATPGVLVNGKLYIGAKSGVELRDRIMEELDWVRRVYRGETPNRR